MLLLDWTQRHAKYFEMLKRVWEINCGTNKVHTPSCKEKRIDVVQKSMEPFIMIETPVPIDLYHGADILSYSHWYQCNQTETGRIK